MRQVQTTRLAFGKFLGSIACSKNHTRIDHQSIHHHRRGHHSHEDRRDGGQMLQMTEMVTTFMMMMVTMMMKMMKERKKTKPVTVTKLTQMLEC